MKLTNDEKLKADKIFNDNNNKIKTLPVELFLKLISSDYIQVLAPYWGPDDFVVIDIGTTSTDTIKGEIIRLTAVKFIDKEPHVFQTWVKPIKPLASENMDFFGIDDEWIENASDLNVAMKDFDNFIKGHLLVCYSLDKIIPLLQEKYNQYLQKDFDFRIESVIDLSKSLDELTQNQVNHIESYGVDDLMAFYNSPNRMPAKNKKWEAVCTSLAYAYMDMINEYRQITGDHSLD